jgi:hypothetical protein
VCPNARDDPLFHLHRIREDDLVAALGGHGGCRSRGLEEGAEGWEGVAAFGDFEARRIACECQRDRFVAAIAAHATDFRVAGPSGRRQHMLAAEIDRLKFRIACGICSSISSVSDEPLRFRVTTRLAPRRVSLTTVAVGNG